MRREWILSTRHYVLRSEFFACDALAAPVSLFSSLMPALICVTGSSLARSSSRVPNALWILAECEAFTVCFSLSLALFEWCPSLCAAL